MTITSRFCAGGQEADDQWATAGDQYSPAVDAEIATIEEWL